MYTIFLLKNMQSFIGKEKEGSLDEAQQEGHNFVDETAQVSEKKSNPLKPMAGCL